MLIELVYSVDPQDNVIFKLMEYLNVNKRFYWLAHLYICYVLIAMYTDT